MNKLYFKERLIMFAVGVFLMTYGVALSCKADLGTSPISSVPWVLSLCMPYSVGEITIAFNLLLVAAQPIMLRSIYWHEVIGQLITLFFFGYGIDFSMGLLNWFTPTSLLEQWVACILSMAILALGVLLEVRAKIFFVPGEGVVMVLNYVTGIAFSTLKNGFDISLVIISVIISYVAFGELRGVGLGTIAAAVMVGRFIAFYAKHLTFINKWTSQK